MSKLVLAAALVCAAPAGAQTLAEAARRAEEARRAAGATTVTFDMRDIDPALARQELVGTRLDETLWPKFLAADKGFASALGASADLRQRYQGLEFSSVRDLEKFIFRERPLADAVIGAGLQLREYAATHLAMVLALQEGRGTPAAVDSLPSVIRENVTFVRGREREIKALATPAAKLNVRIAPMERAVPIPAAPAAPSTVARASGPAPAKGPVPSERGEAARVEGPIDATAGAEIPDFRFIDFHGNTRNLSDFRGKHVLLDFWGSWCGPCRAEVPFAKEAYARFKSRGFEILGLDFEEGASVEQVRAYLNAEGVTWTFAQPDSVRDLIEHRFRIRSFPTLILIDPDRRVLPISRPALRGRQLAVTLDKIFPR